MKDKRSPYKFGKPVWKWNRWERFKDALQYWILEAWFDYLFEHPAARALFEIVLSVLVSLGTIVLLAYLQMEEYIPRVWW